MRCRLLGNETKPSELKKEGFRSALGRYNVATDEGCTSQCCVEEEVERMSMSVYHLPTGDCTSFEQWTG
jgi:hypothetical protein